MAETPVGTSARPWRVIAEEATREVDVRKMVDLIRELNQALDEQGVSRRTEPGRRSA